MKQLRFFQIERKRGNKGVVRWTIRASGETLRVAASATCCYMLTFKTTTLSNEAFVSSNLLSQAGGEAFDPVSAEYPSLPVSPLFWLCCETQHTGRKPLGVLLNKTHFTPRKHLSSTNSFVRSNLCLINILYYTYLFYTMVLLCYSTHVVYLTH